jgi:hypothetical protein
MHAQKQNKMDIYSFICSKAVAEHCRSIGKTWNTLEMAVIIDRSNRTIADKHAAWMEMVEDYPDMPAMPNYHEVQFESVHAMIRERIAYEKQAIAWFKTPENGVYYNCRCNYKGGDAFDNDPFTTFEKALADLNEKWTESEVSNFCFQRIIVDDRESRLYADTDYAGNLYRIDAYAPDEVYEKWFPSFTRDNWESGINLKWHGFEFAELFFIDIPIPFKRGDILMSNGWGRPEIFVLVENNDDLKSQEWYARSLRGEISDGTDMQSWGFFVYETGSLYHEHIGSYDEFEYYEGELKGKDRLLYYVSLFLRDELALDGLLTMHGRLIAEQLLDNNFPIGSHNSWYLEPLLYENRNKKKRKAEKQQ